MSRRTRNNRALVAKNSATVISKGHLGSRSKLQQNIAFDSYRSARKHLSTFIGVPVGPFGFVSFAGLLPRVLSTSFVPCTSEPCTLHRVYAPHIYVRHFFLLQPRVLYTLLVHYTSEPCTLHRVYAPHIYVRHFFLLQPRVLPTSFVPCHIYLSFSISAPG